MKEQTKPADALLEAIKQWHERTDGVTLAPKQLLSEATKVLKERLSL